MAGTDAGRTFRTPHSAFRTWLCVALAGLLFPATGCTRTFWRGRADREVAYLVAEKSNNPRWALPPGFNLNMDPRSRYYDPTNPDHPPMPPDDPYSHVYMHHIDGKRHAPWWHLNGELPSLPNPGWRQRMSEYCEMTPDGAVKLDLPGAVALSYIHSPTHRSQLEQLYLSALDVSAERFRFNLQVYPGTGLSFLRAGTARNGVAVPSTIPGRPPVIVPRSQLTQTNSNAQGSPAVFSREFSTGATLLVNFANSFVWQLAGPHTNNTNTLINLNFVQPLLRGGGRIITLETLTVAERTLLANLRYYERWRQGWFSMVATGNMNNIGNLIRRGGGFGGTGITGFSGQGVGGLGNVASASGFTGFGGGGGAGGLGGNVTAAVAGGAGGSAGVVGGFLGLLQQQQQIENAQNALNLQIRTLKLLEANQQAGLIGISQVDIFRQSIETSKANILSARIALENAKDTFKVTQLGLPPDLPMAFDDTMSTQFQLLDPRVNDLQAAFADLTEAVGDLPVRAAPEQLAPLVDRLGELRNQFGLVFRGARDDLRTLESRAANRVRRMTPAERELFQGDKQRLFDRLTGLETRFEQMSARVEAFREEWASGTTQAPDLLVALAGELSGLAQEIALTKALARVESITIEPVELATVDALQIARAHRLDWMNLRAQLVDQWRLICFNANALRSNLSLTVNGDLGTVGNNPVKFQANNGEMLLGVRFDPPLTRLLERNNYRQALIQYQQFRRSVIQFEDTTNFALRQDMRVLRQLEINLEIQRRAVAIAIRRVDQTREALNQPPPPVQLGATPTTLGPTAATELLTALQAMSDSQNNLMSVYLQYYNNRIQLVQDLGIMRLDSRGMWLDEPIDKGLAVVEQMYPLPPELPVDWLKDAGLEPPALLQTDGVPPLGAGSIEQAKRAAASPETVQPQFNLPRPSEQSEDSIEGTLPRPAPRPGVRQLPTPPPAPPTPQSQNDGASDAETDADNAGAEARRRPSPPAKRGIRDWFFGPKVPPPVKTKAIPVNAAVGPKTSSAPRKKT